MSSIDYLLFSTHFYEHQITNADNGAIKWERYDPSIQANIYNVLQKNDKLAALKIVDTNFEIIFDHENGNHRQRDVISGSECVVRRTPEAIVEDWNIFKKMTDVSKITKLRLRRAFEKNPKIIEHNGHKLTKRFADCTSMWYLNLYDNKLTDDFGIVLARGLATHSSLRFLDLRRNKFSDETGVVLAGGALTSNTSLHTLLLSSNNLGHASGVAFAKALATNTSLRELYLNYNKLGDASGVALAEAFATNTSLRELGLSNNKLGDTSGVAFGKALATNTSLRGLSLWNDNLGDTSGVAFAKALATNTTLRTLNLWKNNLGDTSGVAFAEAVAVNTALIDLTLGNNNLGDTSGVAFAKALTTNTSLRELDLGSNDLSEESGVALVNGLSQNSTLTKLALVGNVAIPPAAQAKIKFALSPELKGLLNNPSVSPSRIPVCVVGFDNVGKTELVNTWHRTTAHDNPHLDPEESAEAKSDDERDKTSGICIKAITLRCSSQDNCRPPTAPPTIKRRKREVDGWTVDITVWDFAGHGEYYVSHRLVASGCRDALFVVLFRIDRLLHPDTRKAEIERLFFWLRFVTTMRSNQSQQQLPTVFIGGSFRPNTNVFDLSATSEWTDWVLREAKQVFGSQLNIPQQKVHLMDCRKCYDPHVVALRNTLADSVDATRTREDRKIPLICETARGLLHHAKQDVALKLASYEQHLQAYKSNPNASVTPLPWQHTVCSPIMSRTDFEEHVLGKLKVKADEMGGEKGFVESLDTRGGFAKKNCPLTEIPTFAPKSKQLLQIITTYLHDVGDILWFDVDGLRDTVILTPDLFCSKIIGAIFRPDTPGFSIDAVHGGGGLVPKSTIVTTFKRALGIDDTNVDAALAILCQLGLCHRHQDGDGRESYLFPGALVAATSYRRLEWFGPLAPGRHFVVGRRFTLIDPATTIFAPGCMSEIQVWALGRYKRSMIWRDGVIIPYTATHTLAEAGVQLHRPHSSSQDGDKCAQVSMSSITVVVRGGDADAQPDCLRLLNQLCEKIRATSGTQLVEEALPPNEVAKSSSNNSNMLDVTCPGFPIPPILDGIRGVVVGGKLCTIDSLRFGSFVDIPHPVQSILTPNSWTGHDFEPVCGQTPKGGAHLLVEIPRDHADFNRVETNMRRSVPTAVICKIQRVQNRALWNKYFLARSDVAKECEDGSSNEIEAWHSTGTTDPWLICRDWKAGFDVNRSVIAMRYAYNDQKQLTRAFKNIDNKSYGTGVYLAEHFIYSDTLFPHVRPNSRDKQIILAKVTLGNNFNYGKNLPDLRSAIEPEGYHSITGTEDDMKFLLERKQKLGAQGRWTSAFEELVATGDVYGRQYVVHRSNQVYPAYLVTYTTKAQREKKERERERDRERE